MYHLHIVGLWGVEENMNEKKKDVDIIIPDNIVKKFNIKEGDKIVFEGKDGYVVCHL